MTEVIEYGYKYFGDKFKPILEYINYDKYMEFLTTIDVAVFYHNRQQGVGNILLLSYLCKKVYIKKETGTYNCLNNMGINIYDSNSIDKNIFEYNYDILRLNSINTIKNFSDNEILKLSKSIFLDQYK